MSKIVGVIGNGFVGNAVYENFKDRVETRVYDVIPEKSLNTYSEVLSSDYIFVCLPTPMKDDGDCNISYVCDFFNDVPLHSPGLFVLKSTVPIGTTDALIKQRNDLRIVHYPEFLTADNAVEDFFNSDRNIFGGSYTNTVDLKDFLYSVITEWEERQVEAVYVSAKESETIKYFSNCFLALKVSYFNILYQTCETFGMNYDSVRLGVTLDERIGTSHTKVPGSDGKLGYGGYCFPKDINALIYHLQQYGIDVNLLTASWNYNQSIRPL